MGYFSGSRLLSSDLKLAFSIVRCYSKGAHYSALPSDTFDGKIITKTRILDKGVSRGPVKYGGKYIATLLPGAPPGPKFMSYIKDIFQQAHIPVYFEEISYADVNNPKETDEFAHLALLSMHRNGVGIKGNLISSNLAISSNVSIRHELDLYVCVVCVKCYPNVKCKYPNIDLIICRQNTEGYLSFCEEIRSALNGKRVKLEKTFLYKKCVELLRKREYAMLEHSTRPGVVESLKIITEENTLRFAEWCFKFAIREKRKKITIVHKANIMKLSDGLFMKVVKDVGKSYPEIEVNDIIVDNATMQLVQNPSQFDMLVTPNLYGNILSNIACGLAGGSGLLSAQNYGNDCALFEAGSRHLTFQDEENLNPVALINASVDLLRYLGQSEHANLIQKAITKTLSDDQIQTHDLGGSHSEEEVVESIKKNVNLLLKDSKIKLF